jgi:antitoxin HicB
MKKRCHFTVSDGELMLQLEVADEGGYIVTSPFEPELVTEAETLEDAFVMAKDAIKALRASRAKLYRKLAAAKGES